MKTEPDSNERSRANRALEQWWEGLKDRTGDRALLRRCRSALEVAACPYFHHLYRALQGLGYGNGPQLAPAAAVLAHVRRRPEGGERSLARMMASPRPGTERPRVSGLRFRRILVLDNRDDLLMSLVRVVRLLDGAAPVAGLANDIYFWGDAVKERWAYEYYAAAPQAD